MADLAVRTGELLLSDTKLVQKMESELQKLVTQDRLIRRYIALALFEIKQSPKLMKSTLFSIMTAIVEAASLGLEISRTTGQAYLVPFQNNKKAGKPLEAKLMVGYRGLALLASREGIKVYASSVFAKDKFTLRLGSHPEIIHEPFIPTGKEKGTDGIRMLSEEYRGAYAVFTYPNGYTLPIFHDRKEVERRKSRSKASDDGPWVTDFYAMGEKGTIRDGASRFIAHDLAPRLVEVATRDEHIDLALPAAPLTVTDMGVTSEDVAAEIVSEEAPGKGKGELPAGVEPSAETSKGKETGKAEKAPGKASGAFLDAEGILKAVVSRGKVIYLTLDTGNQELEDFSTFDRNLAQSLRERVNCNIRVFYREKQDGEKLYKNLISFEAIQ
jgi:recombination protein RecT